MTLIPGLGSRTRWCGSCHCGFPDGTAEVSRRIDAVRMLPMIPPAFPGLTHRVMESIAARACCRRPGLAVVNLPAGSTPPLSDAENIAIAASSQMGDLNRRLYV
jgi:hypothetical protein